MTATDDRGCLYPLAFPAVAELRPLPQLAPGGQSVPGTARPASDLSYAPERAVIGNALRLPLVWCEFGSCIARFADAAALGESDVRRRALVAGWRQDGLGRLACPGCVQHDPTFTVTYPLAKPAVARCDADRAVPSELRAADDPPPAARPSAWDGPPPRLYISAPLDSEPSKSAWRRHRNSGRHRERLRL